MGMRINKMLGYGLTDVATEDYRITDPRINADSFLLGPNVPPAEDYIAFLERTADMNDSEVWLETGLLKGDTGADADSSDLCTWRCEYGLPNVLLLRPFGFAKWHRWASPIDVEEEAIRGKGMDYRVERTISGLEPWSGLHMDVRTGGRIEGNTVNLWRRVINGLSEDDTDRLPILNALARAMGYADHAEAERYIAPYVPDEIRRICQWGELFTSPEVCFQLRPLLYTYWS